MNHYFISFRFFSKQQKVLIALFCFLFVLTNCMTSKPNEEKKKEETNTSITSGETSEAEEGAPVKQEVSKKETLPALQSEKNDLSSDQKNLSQSIKSRREDAIFKAASQVLAQEPNNVKALNALGLYYYKKKQFLAAQYMFSKAIKQNPEASALHNNLGLVHLSLKENREALRSFHKALEVQMDDGIAAANLGALYVEYKNFAKAAIALEVAYKNGQKDFKTLNNYGAALVANGIYDQAVELYQQALKINNSSKEVLFNLSIVLIEHLDKKKEGMETLNRLKFLGPAPNMRNKIIFLENKANAGLK